MFVPSKVSFSIRVFDIKPQYIIRVIKFFKLSMYLIDILFVFVCINELENESEYFFAYKKDIARNDPLQFHRHWWYPRLNMGGCGTTPVRRE